MIKPKAAIMAVLAVALIGAGIAMVMFYSNINKAPRDIAEIYASEDGWRVSLDSSKGFDEAIYLYKDDEVAVAFDMHDAYFTGLSDAPDKALAFKVVRPEAGHLKPEVIDLARERVRIAVSKYMNVGLISDGK